MLQTNQLERIFIHKDNGQEVRLSDPGETFSPDMVLNFYAGTYPVLTNARIVGPEIKNDEIPAQPRRGANRVTCFCC